jgi:putative sugar O-methyltransferase
MKMDTLATLLHEYSIAPTKYQATSYWASYQQRLLDTIETLDVNELRSGKYPILAPFGFNDVLYTYHPNAPLWKTALLRFIRRYGARSSILPYRVTVSDIQEAAYHHCELMGRSTNSIPISDIEVSTFGSPQDLFQISSHQYTMGFLNFYIRYCFSNKHISFKGDELIVELGSGSGYQVEVLKKLYPGMTILCFDLPAQIYLCAQYLTRALESSKVHGPDVTLGWKDLSGIKRGDIYLFGNWQFPLLRDQPIDVFWNAASFGEMEPDIVESYLDDVRGNATWIYLLQARHGKETSGKTHVRTPIVFDDYNRFLAGYVLQEERDAWYAHRRLSESGGYFEAVWRNKRE